MANIWTDTAAGPASYTTGGFVVTTTLSTVAFFNVELNQAGANLGQVTVDVALNTPAAGQVTVKILRENYDQLTTVGSPSGLPSGITNRSTSGGTYDTVSHNHTMDHNHAVTPASSTPNSKSTNTLAIALQPAATTHTHTVDLPTLTQDTANESAHSHTWDNIYQHQQTLTNTTTDLATTELASTTDISGATFNYLATDA